MLEDVLSSTEAGGLILQRTEEGAVLLDVLPAEGRWQVPARCFLCTCLPLQLA